MKNMNYIKTYEEAKIAVVTKQEVDDSKNWNAEYQVNKSAGKKPFKKTGLNLTPVEPGKTLGKTTVYFTEQQAKNLNEIARSIQEMENKYEELTQEYSRT